MGKVRKTDSVRTTLLKLLVLALLLSLGGYLCALDNAFRISSSQPERIVLELLAPEPQFEDVTIEGNTFTKINLEGAAASGLEAYPDLPLYSGRVAIPANANYRITYECLNPRDYTVTRPKPVLPESGRALLLSEAYSDSSKYPAEQVTDSGEAWLRDFRVLSLQASPISWNPVQNRITCYEKIRVSIELDYPDSAPAAYTTYSYAFKEIYEAQILNFDQYRELVQTPQSPRLLVIHGEYDSPVFLAKLKDFVAWKRQKGFDVTVASTSTTGNSSVDIKAYIQNLYDDPETRPDYIVLVGDVSGNFPVPTWYEVESGYNGEGDDPYTLLSGNDDLVDAFIGRISAEDNSQLGTLLNKIYAYEKNVDISSPASDWLNRMLLIGDPHDSGISCAYVTHHIHEIAEETNPDYSFIEEYSQSFDHTMTQGLNQGVAFFTYRGIGGVSGWSPTNPLYNGTKLPHSVILTCGTGSFNGTAFSEEMVRKGTEAVPAGAVSCIGMATTGTHTALNNALMIGMMNGIFTYGMRTMGQALMQGKLYTHAVYSSTMPFHVRFFSHWCNLMGDPSLEAWVGIPKVINLGLPQEIPAGTSLLQVEVLDEDLSPLEGASVTAFCPGENTILAKAFSGADGFAYLNLPSDYSSQILITASKANYKPVQQTLTYNQAGSLNYASQLVIDDGSQGSQGNANATVNATETIALELGILNSMDEAVSAFTAILGTTNPHVEILDATADYPALASGASSASTSPFLIRISSGLAPVERIHFSLSLSGDFGTNLVRYFYLDAHNACLEPLNYSLISGGDNVLDPGETATLSLQINNDGHYHASDLLGTLSSLTAMATVIDSLSVFGTVQPGGEAVSAQSFSLRADSRLVPGMQIPLKLKLHNSAGFEQFCIFNIPVGTVSQNDPLGPDEYGYLIYDTTDTDYPECPVYEWIEINPVLGGLGVAIPDISDTGVWYGEGDALTSRTLAVRHLPFLFPFYGIYYNLITVSTNGFIAFGVTEDGEFRNTILPGGQGPAPMIAPFWDDMSMNTSSNIFEYYDAANHIFIIQYDTMKNGYDNETLENFQIIFYDPLIYNTGLGDGMIKIQYKDFNNIDVGGFNGNTPLGGNYCTVGLKDHTNTRGLQYTFNNSYAQAAAPLSHETALLITTVPHIYSEAHLQPNQVVIMDDNGDSYLEPGETAEIGLKLKNLGIQTARDISVTIEDQSEYLTIFNPSSTYPDIPSGTTAVNNSPFVVCIADSCPNNQLIVLPCTINLGGKLIHHSLTLEVKKPLISLVGSLMNDSGGNDNGILEPGESAELLVLIRNNSPVSAGALTCYITANPTHMTILDSLVTFETIPANSVVQAAFSVIVDPSIPIGTNVPYYMNISSALTGIQTAQAFKKVGGTGSIQSFENNSGNYIPSDTQSWAWGSSELVEAHTGSKLWGTVLNGNYPSSTQSYLMSGPFYVTANSFLEFWHYLDSELGRDGGKLQFFSNGVYTDLVPAEGYPCSYVEALDGPGYSGQLGWVKARFNISHILGNGIRFRWLFASDAQNSGLGWYIDDVAVVGYDGIAGLVKGQVHFESDRKAETAIRVWNQDGYSVPVDSTGAYKLYLPIGEHDLTVQSPGYQTTILSGLSVYPGHTSIVHDFDLIELKAVENLLMTHTDEAIQLSWQAPPEPYYPVRGYKVLRKINASGFDDFAELQDTCFVDLLLIPGRYTYKVIALYDAGESLPCQTDSLSFPFNIIPPPPPPTVSRLYANYPNPFNPTTTISFDLATAGEVELRIYNIRGQLVKTLLRTDLEAGHHKYIWDGTDHTNRRVSSGVYFYRLQAPHYSNARRMVLLK